MNTETITRDIKAASIRPGMWMMGRRDFHINVTEVKHGTTTVTIVGLNRFGEEVTSRYGVRDLVTCWYESH